jgi:hypothetical protein
LLVETCEGARKRSLIHGGPRILRSIRVKRVDRTSIAFKHLPDGARVDLES